MTGHDPEDFALPLGERLAWWLTIVITLALVAAVLVRCRMAQGQESIEAAVVMPRRDLSPDSAAAPEMQRAALLSLARVCHLEATWRRADCIAIYWVATRRAEMRGIPWADALTSYSVLYRSDTPRAREVSAYPWGDVPGKSARWNRRWADLRALAVELAAGEHGNPCEGAIGWGGTVDAVRDGQVPVVCAAKTANWFYAGAR